MTAEIIPFKEPRALAGLAVKPPVFLPNAKGAERFFGFFTAHICNRYTRQAYYKAACRFSDWCEGKGLLDLAQVKPPHAAAYVEMLGLPACDLKHNFAVWQAYALIGPERPLPVCLGLPTSRCQGSVEPHVPPTMLFHSVQDPSGRFSTIRFTEGYKPRSWSSAAILRVSRNSLSRRRAVPDKTHRRCSSAIARRTAGKYLFMKPTVIPRRLQRSRNDGTGFSLSAAAAFLSRSALHSTTWALRCAARRSHRSGSCARKTVEVE
jgi:hypothetical protein